MKISYVKFLDYDTVMQVVHYVLDGHNVTETSQYFGVSRGTIDSILNLVRLEGQKYYQAELAKQIETTLEQLVSNARKEAGSKSHRPEILSEEDVIDVIYCIIFLGYNTRVLGKKYHCSNMTISNAIKRLDNPKIQEIIGDARILYSKYKTNPMYSYIAFRRVFNSDKLSTIQDEETLFILRSLYERAIEEFGYKRRDCEQVWTR